MTDDVLGFLQEAAGADDAAPLLNDHRSELDRALGITYLRATAQEVAAALPVEGNRQPVGLLHGGATIALCESVGSLAAMLHAAPLGRVAVGIEVSASHHRSATSGAVTARAVPVQLGRSLTVHEVVVTDDRDRRISTIRITNFLKDR